MRKQLKAAFVDLTALTIFVSAVTLWLIVLC